MKKNRKQDQKDAVAVVSAVLFVGPPGFWLMAKSLILMSRWGLSVGLYALIAVPLSLVFMAIGMLIGQIVWMFVMSFYLSVESYDRWINQPTPYIPVITNACNRVNKYIRQKKIEREN
ncbi:MAG: hypothetical protein QY329_09345 [Anaerolineales bacterium]|nr:MAG: hypothetical protein QY329_09345 [Anaerolineales bacterium]